MEDKTVPYLAYELEQAKHERTVKRLVTALIVSVVFMFLTNLAWLYVWSGYDIETDTDEITIDSPDGITNFVGRDGSINNGTN